MVVPWYSLISLYQQFLSSVSFLSLSLVSALFFLYSSSLYRSVGLFAAFYTESRKFVNNNLTWNTRMLWSIGICVETCYPTEVFAVLLCSTIRKQRTLRFGRLTILLLLLLLLCELWFFFLSLVDVLCSVALELSNFVFFFLFSNGHEVTKGNLIDTYAVVK